MNMIKFIRASKNKYKKLREMGIKLGENCEIYDNVSWGSEPYMISIGNHVRITNGVRFITHDGGVWVLRAMEDSFKDVDSFGAKNAAPHSLSPTHREYNHYAKCNHR